jgi:hypothetical protein
MKTLLLIVSIVASILVIFFSGFWLAEHMHYSVQYSTYKVISNIAVNSIFAAICIMYGSYRENKRLTKYYKDYSVNLSIKNISNKKVLIDVNNTIE